MAKLTYWVAPCLQDSEVYSIRRRTRKEVVAALNDGTQNANHFGAPMKVEVLYKDAFDLAVQCLTGVVS